MEERTPELGEIEFETTSSLSGDAPAPLSGAATSTALPALVVALVIGGLLAGLMWTASRSDSTAVPEVPVDDQPAAENSDPVDGAEESDEADEQPDDAEVEEPDVLIPATSRASIALEPTRPPLGFGNAVSVGGEWLALGDEFSDEGSAVPLISRSVDGDTWEELETRAVIDGADNVEEYFWWWMRSAGDVLMVDAFGPVRGSDRRNPVTFSSIDGIDWQASVTPNVGDAPPIFAQSLAITDSYTVVAVHSGPEALTQFVEDHTTAVDVSDVCFAEGDTVYSCESDTTWVVNEETIDSDFAPDVVLACFELLADAAWGLGLDLIRFGADGQEEPFELSINPSQFLPVLLSDGRIAGIDRDAPSDATACDGLAVVEEVDPLSFYVFDPATNTIDRAELEPSLLADETEVLGQFPIAGSDLFVVRSQDELWSFDLHSGEWLKLDVNLPSTEGLPRPVFLSDSGRRLYGFDRRDLSVIDLEFVSGQLVAHETVVYVPLPVANPFVYVTDATDDEISFEANSQSWLLDVPRGLRCAQQFADALAGNGLVENC